MSNDDKFIGGGHPQIDVEKTLTIRSKFEEINEKYKKAKQEIEDNIKELDALREEKNKHHAQLKTNTENTKKNLLNELEKVQKEMAKHLELQREENQRLQKLITGLKGEKTVLMNKLIALQRRISDMETQVGAEDLKFL